MQNFIYDVGDEASKPYVAIRFPGSGSNPRHEMPDILAKIEGVWYAFELKYTTGEYARFPQSQMSDLIAFADDAGAEPGIAARFSQHRRKFWFINARDPYEDLLEKNQKSMSLKRQDKSEYERLQDLFDVEFNPDVVR